MSKIFQASLPVQSDLGTDLDNSGLYIDIPDELRDHFLESVGGIKSVYAISDEIKTWFEKELYAH